jgi:hypothetical protein
VTRRAAWVLWCCLLPVTTGCTVHQKFERQSVPPAAVGTTAMPLKLAVLSDRSMTFDYPRIAYLRAFVEVMNPGLADTLQTAFSGRFQNVTVVDTRADAQSADLMLSPSLELSDPLKLTIRFVEPNSGRLVAELSSKRPYKNHAPGMYSKLGTDLILFAIVVAFPPSELYVTHTIQKHDAERFNAIFAPAVAEMVGDVADQASRDAALHAFAPLRGAPGPPLKRL